MNIIEITNNNCATKQILSESWQELSESQKIYLSEFEKELWPLMESLVSVFEQRLSSEEIEDIFSKAEQNFKGKNTGLGKAAKVTGDTAKKINQFLDKQGKKLQDTEPVKNFDQKAEKLKQQIKDDLGSDSKVIQQVNKYADWAKENPGKTAFVIGVLTAAAAFASGPAGGAAVGFLMRSANEMIKGESASGSIGKAAKTAAVGALAGFGLDALGDSLSASIESAALNEFPDTKRVEMNFSKIGNGEAIFRDVQAFGRTDDVNFVSQKYNAAIEALKSGDYETYNQEWSEMQGKVAEMNSIDYMESIVSDNEKALEWYKKTQELDNALDVVAAGVQGAAQEKSNTAESVNEGPRDAVKNVRKQATQKITKQKLMRAWKKQGKPTDAASIYDILSNAGLSSKEITSLGLEKPKQSKNSQEPNATRSSDDEQPQDAADSSKDTVQRTKKSQQSKADKKPKTGSQQSSKSQTKKRVATQKSIENLAKEVVKSGFANEVLKKLEKG